MAERSAPGLTKFGPDEVRALRGERSRAAFAELLGVTPLTVYRWELPEGAPQARRPRGEVLERLRRFAAGSAEPAARLPDTRWTREEARVLPALERISRGDWRRSESELLTLLASNQLETPDGRSLAAAGLAQIHLLHRSDAQAALSALLPALEDADSGRLSASVAAQVHASAALSFAWTDGRIHDPARAGLHAERAEALAEPHAVEIRFLARLSGVLACFAVTDADRALLGRSLSRLSECLDAELPPLLRGWADEAQGLGAWIGGRNAAATRWFEQTAALAERSGYPCLLSRALAFTATRQLDELGSPQAALDLARRAQSVARSARLGLGLHTMFATAAEGEALLRLGRLDEAAQALLAGRDSLNEAGIPPVVLISAVVRTYTIAGRHRELADVADRLEARARVSQAHGRPGMGAAVLPAYAAFVRGVARLFLSDPPEQVVEAFREAERMAGDWVLLQREVLLDLVPALVLTGRLEEAQLALRRAQRILDQFPSPSRAALLRHWEGTLLLFQARWAEARHLIEAASATFRAAGSIPEAALTRRTLVLLALHAGDPDASARLAESDAELQRLGIPRNAWPRFDTVPAPRKAEEAPEAAAAPGVDALVAPIKRLTLRGVAPPLIQRELVSVLRGLFPGRLLRLEEVDSKGAIELLADAADAAAGLEWFEFGDGAGRRLRLGVGGPLSDAARASITTLTNVTGLALEVSVLRGFSQPREWATAADTHPEMPGFIAASPAMRQLRAELGRLAASKATSIITGESGVGKEVVARALHGLSSRAGRPYVAFNCAAVPRELFEGQLFGYRKGAFTGAAMDHPGVLRSAQGGTLFLDEVGELPLDVQPKLLRFLENGEVFPLGEVRPVTVDVRVIAATHRDLEKLVKEGRFREDLFYRLQVVPIRVPPLRERREDVVALARHFLELYSPKGDPPALSADAVARLTGHSWPGNVRELRNVIERTLAFGPVPQVVAGEVLRF